MINAILLRIRPYPTPPPLPPSLPAKHTVFLSACMQRLRADREVICCYSIKHALTKTIKPHSARLIYRITMFQFTDSGRSHEQAGGQTLKVGSVQTIVACSFYLQGAAQATSVVCSSKTHKQASKQIDTAFLSVNIIYLSRQV